MADCELGSLLYRRAGLDTGAIFLCATQPTAVGAAGLGFWAGLDRLVHNDGCVGLAGVAPWGVQGNRNSWLNGISISC